MKRCYIALIRGETMTDRQIGGETGGIAGKAGLPAALPRLVRVAAPLSVAVLAAAVLACGGLLLVPVTLPLGPMYWDLAIYLDGANRIASGQSPLIDFFTPVGPLGYWLFAGLDRIFPDSQPLLLAQWSTFVVTAPAMALILRDVEARSRPVALALLAPFLAFQILPINVENHSFFPGVDGYGVYNRQVSIVLYVLAAGLVWVRDRRVLTGVIVWTMLALLLIKVTGFLAGGLMVGFALLAGRIDLRQAMFAAAIACLPLIALELWSGLVSAYVASIATLLMLNAGGILPRFLQAASLHLDIVGASLALIACLAVLSRREIAAGADALLKRRDLRSFQALLDRDVFWLGVAVAAGLFFETQNTGGQAFIFAWPVLLTVVAAFAGSGRRGAFIVLALVAATAIPPLETVLQRAGRTLLAQINYVALPHSHLGRLGLVSQHRDVIERARTMRAIYAGHPATFQAISDQRLLPGPTLYSDLDFQAGWLMAIDEGVGAILAHEAREGVRFGTIMSLNFANPFPYLMNRTGVRHIAIGADPFRAVPEPDAEAVAAIADADLIVKPRCPVTVANEALHERYRAAMADRVEIALGPCWTGYVKTAVGLRR